MLIVIIINKNKAAVKHKYNSNMNFKVIYKIKNSILKKI